MWRIGSDNVMQGSEFVKTKQHKAKQKQQRLIIEEPICFFDGLVLIWHQDICNHQDDVGRSARAGVPNLIDLMRYRYLPRPTEPMTNAVSRTQLNLYSYICLSKYFLFSRCQELSYVLMSIFVAIAMRSRQPFWMIEFDLRKKL